MATTRTFTREQLRNEMDLPGQLGDGIGCTVIANEITDTGRWTVHHRLTFRLDGQAENEAWRVNYRTAATEQQDERPWEYDKEVTATLVRLVEKLVKVWEPAE